MVQSNNYEKKLFYFSMWARRIVGGPFACFKAGRVYLTALVVGGLVRFVLSIFCLYININKIKRMKIKAKFKGADGSLGFRNGENYALDFSTRLSGRITYEVILVEAMTAPPKKCTYDSLKAFLNNWQIL